jgi:hypothetical protein
MHDNRGLGAFAWSEIYDFPGNLVQYLFPSTVPTVDTTVSDAYLQSMNAAAPQTAAKQKTWTPEDLWEAQAQKGTAASSIVAAAAGQDQTSAPAKKTCSWYQTLGSDESCSFGSTLLWGALIAGGAALFLARR